MRTVHVRALLSLAAFVAVWFVSGRAYARDATALLQMSFASHSGLPTLAISSNTTLVSATGVSSSSVSSSSELLSDQPGESLDTTGLAPLCDPRGASSVAPRPQMQDVESTLENTRTLEDCLLEGAQDRWNHSTTSAHRGPVPASPTDAFDASQDAAVLSTRVSLARSRSERLSAPGPGTTCFRPGIRSTVDRPPRA